MAVVQKKNQQRQQIPRCKGYTRTADGCRAKRVKTMSAGTAL
jgi:hypothetical protein